MHKLFDHPAVVLGRWIKAARQKRGIVKRRFATQISLTPAQYTELEAGVIRWLGDAQRRAIPAVLDIVETELRKFVELVEKAKQAVALTFGNIFSREDLEPIRYRWNDESKKPGEFERTMILNAVFSDELQPQVSVQT